MVFCIGVPVRSSLFLQLKLSKTFHRTLQNGNKSDAKLEETRVREWRGNKEQGEDRGRRRPSYLELLLMAWASSRIMYCHLTRWKYLMS